MHRNEALGPSDSPLKQAQRSQQSLTSMSGPNWSNFQSGDRKYTVLGDGVVRGFYNQTPGVYSSDVQPLVNLGCTKP
jgi:hypothetical protein